MKRFSKSIMGVTLLEVMLVLAIAAMIIVMSVRYYQSATATQQANSVVQQLQSITAAADNLALSSGSYANSGTSITTTNLSPLLPNGANAFITPWGTTITIGTPASNSYPVTVPSAPSGVCPLIVAKLATNNHYASLSPSVPTGCGSVAVDITYTYLANP